MSIVKKVEELREAMNKAIEIHGPHSNEALIASQALDPYINKYMKCIN